MAGLPGEVASALSKRLLAKGVSHDRQLFANYSSGRKKDVRLPFGRVHPQGKSLPPTPTEGVQ
eukprot:scaffold262627_cov18-Tisochrysis_lutea.AAC.1